MATRIIMSGLAIIIACLLEGCGRDNEEAELNKKLDELQQQLNSLKKAKTRVRVVASVPMLTAPTAVPVLAPAIRTTAEALPYDQATANAITTANVAFAVGEPPVIVSPVRAEHYSVGNSDNGGGDSGGWYYNGYSGGWYPRDYSHRWYGGQCYGYYGGIAGQCYGYRTVNRTVNRIIVTKPHHPDNGCHTGYPNYPAHPGYPTGGYHPGPNHPNGGYTHPVTPHPTHSTSGNHRR